MKTKGVVVAGLVAAALVACLPELDLSGARCESQAECGGGFACLEESPGDFRCRRASPDGGSVDAGTPADAGAGGGDGGTQPDGGVDGGEDSGRTPDGGGDGGSFADGGATSGLASERFVAADFDGDGTPDLMFTDGVGPVVSRWRGQSGGFVALSDLDAGLAGIRLVIATDMVGNPLPDLLLIPKLASQPAKVLRNNSGNLFDEVPFPISLLGSTLRGAAAFDFDRDGIRDLAIGTESSTLARVEVYRGLSAGGFQLVNEPIVNYPLASGDPLIFTVLAATQPSSTLVAAATGIGIRNSFIALDGGQAKTPDGGVGAHLSGDFISMRSANIDQNAFTDLVALSATGSLYAFINKDNSLRQTGLLMGTGYNSVPTTGITDYCLGNFTPASTGAGLALLTASPSGVLRYPSIGDTLYGHGFGPSVQVLDGGTAGVLLFDATDDGVDDLVAISSGAPPRMITVLPGL